MEAVAITLEVVVAAVGTTSEKVADVMEAVEENLVVVATVLVVVATVLVEADETVLVMAEAEVANCCKIFAFQEHNCTGNLLAVATEH